MMREDINQFPNKQEGAGLAPKKDALDDFPAIKRIIEKLNKSPLSFEDLEQEHRSVSRIEKGVKSLYEQSLERYLRLRGIKAEVRKVSDKLFEIDLEEGDWQIDDLQLDELPSGYVYHGGAARSVLERKLGVNPNSRPRDLDLGYAGDRENRVYDEYLSKKYCPDDYASGHGVTTVSNNYFSTRDFTINEVLVAGKKVIFTKDCLLDTVRGILRFTDFEIKESYDASRPYFIKNKLLAKALRFAGEKELLLADEEVYQFQGIDAFHIALHLDRALGTSKEVTNAYIKQLKEKEQIPPNIKDASELIQYLAQNTDFVFRCAKQADIFKEESILVDGCKIKLEDLAEEYEQLPFKESMSKGKK